jgi:threonine dehydratase
VGGGGLISGTSIAARAIRPGITIYGAEPAGADDAARGFASGKVEPLPHPDTIADGLRATLSERTLQAIRRNVTAIPTASEAAIASAMRMTWERMKIVIEPSSAGAAGLPAGVWHADRGKACRHHRQRRQRRSRSPAVAIASVPSARRLRYWRNRK